MAKKQYIPMPKDVDSWLGNKRAALYAKTIVADIAPIADDAFKGSQKTIDGVIRRQTVHGEPRSKE
jgi:hypothetical protein